MTKLFTASVCFALCLNAWSGDAPARRELAWPEPPVADVDTLKKELRTQLNDQFSIVSVGPWVIAGDMLPDRVQQYADSTIAIYGGAIQRQLFTRAPRSEPVKVYLFRDKVSYEDWNVKLFGRKPTTPYGFYSRQHKALVMNIGTGGGTLLHEMVHAMAEADFPEIPSWLNEGLGSLFEASNSDRAGKVFGVTNWRLKGLHEDLKQNRATPLKDLLAMSTDAFYGDRSSSNYAVARYLMQYLQENGKLENFYTRIRDKKDADAETSLRAVFDNKLTTDAIEKACFDWARGLSLK